MYSVSDANANEGGLTFDEAVRCIAEWYEDCDQWATGYGNPETHESIAKAIASIEQPTDGDESDLQDYADSICEAVAVACGKRSFAGHGNYYVSAAGQGGFSLTVMAGVSE